MLNLKKGKKEKENAEPIEMIQSPIVHLLYDGGTRVE